MIQDLLKVRTLLRPRSAYAQKLRRDKRGALRALADGRGSWMGTPPSRINVGL
jgi:hypothetical protein